MIKHYYQGKTVTCLCHITDTLYLVGFYSDKLRVWNEQNEQEMCLISDDRLYSIKRVMSTDYYFLKTRNNELKLLTINDLKSKQFTIKHLLEVKQEGGNLTDSL